MVEQDRSPLSAGLATGDRSFSFEFFPPRTDAGEAQLWRAMRRLEALSPTFVSVTYGAGGSTRDRTTRITERIAADTLFTPVAHLTCVGSTVPELRSVIAGYAAAGVGDILAIRGDPQGGPNTPWVSTPGGLEHADELVRLIKSLGSFSVGVAAFPEGHPESSNPDEDVEALLRKQESGADYAVTQFFFDAADYLRLRDRAAEAGVTIPIIAGIMPVTNVGQIERFAQLSGAAFPDELSQRFHAAADEEAVRELGVEIATEMCAELLAEGAPGLHFYTLNRSTATSEIYANLGLHERDAA